MTRTIESASNLVDKVQNAAAVVSGRAMTQKEARAVVAVVLHEIYWKNRRHGSFAAQVANQGILSMCDDLRLLRPQTPLTPFGISCANEYAPFLLDRI